MFEILIIEILYKCKYNHWEKIAQKCHNMSQNQLYFINQARNLAGQ